MGVGLGVGVGVGTGVGAAVGAGVGVAVGAGVAVGEGDGALPLNEMFVGAFSKLPGDATNPKLTVAPGGIDWFQDTGMAL